MTVVIPLLFVSSRMVERNISSLFSRNSEADASEFQENNVDMYPRYIQCL